MGFGGPVFLLLFGAAPTVHGENTPAASGPLDATLFTTYTLDSLDTSVSWVVKFEFSALIDD